MLNRRKAYWLDKKKKSKLQSLKCFCKHEKPDLLNIEKNLDLYLHPIELKLRDRYLQIVQKHGNGLWALEELVWEVYDKHIVEYEALNEEEKFILNMYMRVLRSLYK